MDRTPQKALTELAKKLGITRKPAKPQKMDAPFFTTLTDKQHTLRKRKRKQAKFARRRNRR